MARTTTSTSSTGSRSNWSRSFGDGGRQPGHVLGVHSIAVDSKGNIYTTETYTGKRLQKFVYKGMVALDKKSQGAPWPTRTSTQ